MSVLLGNGDGTFQLASTFIIGASYLPTSVAVGDFNGDGLLDLGVTSQSDYYYDYDYGGYFYGGWSYANVLLGNGDGGFSGQTAPCLPDGCYFSAAVADFNGDGIDDFATASAGGGTVSVLTG